MKHFWTTIALVILVSVILTAVCLWYLSQTTELSRASIEPAMPRVEQPILK